jgi:CRP-like cAMP-binding protein
VLLYLHADTYNAVLRQHHFRQTRLDSSIALLQELPLFQQLSPSVLTAIAYTIKSQTYSRNEVVVADGEVINNLFLIASGDIKVHAPAVATTTTAAATSSASASVDSTDSRSVSIRKTRPPSVAVAVMSRGKLIGEAEVFQDARLFEFSYRVSSSIAELLAIPATVLREALHANRVKESQVYRSIEAAHLQKKMVIDERVKTALRMTTAMMMAKSTTEGQGSIRSKELKSKSELGTSLLTYLLAGWMDRCT